MSRDELCRAGSLWQSFLGIVVSFPFIVGAVQGLMAAAAIIALLAMS
jgi:hypothetical protein